MKTTFIQIPRILAVGIFMLLALLPVKAQILNPIKWSATVSDVKGCEATLVFTAKLDKGWHVYSQNPGAPDPTPTVFTFAKNAAYDRVGVVTESNSIKKFEKVFDGEVIFFEGVATFRQKIKINSSTNFKIAGTVEFGVCDDSKCLPPDTWEFDIAVNGCVGGAVGATGATGTTGVTGTTGTTGTTAPIATTNQVDTTTNASGGCTGCAAEIEKAVAKALGKESDATCCDTCVAGALQAPDLKTLEPVKGDVITEADHSNLGYLIAGFIGGLLALLTPCVFPMIPMTVSFFTKRSKDRKTGIRNALIYAISIIAIYVSLGMLVTIVFGAGALNDMASNVYFNLLFFFVFVIFALSFLGVFEITLPSSFVNKVDQKSDRGGLMGIFFMAFTLALVSFSCTGPIIGSLLVEAANGGYFGPAVGMFGFALALALPFALFAMFPGWLNTLPKSGGWLNTVKVTLGFIELALALKFLSNVDLAYHWGFLKRELFLAIWIIIGVLLGLYLLGKIKLSHDSDLPHISVPRLLTALVTFVLVVYMMPGIWGAPTNFFSGFLPPSYYKEWKTTESECPHDLSCFHDLQEGMDYAAKHCKPVFVDFTGYSCVNCRKMEDNVWSQKKIYDLLNEDYVVVSLYVDDKNPLPEAEWFKTKAGKSIKAVGKKWGALQEEIYGSNSQPYYVLLDNTGKVLAEPRGYTPEVGEYEAFLKAGLERYKVRTGRDLLADKKKGH